MTVSEEGKYMGYDIEEQSDPSVHNCSPSCPLGFGLQPSRSRCFELFDLLGLGGIYS
jgi:hypothetical protein